jgi:pyrimidine operon attenuation protein/uracil phosphoribosyltransferase
VTGPPAQCNGIQNSCTEQAARHQEARVSSGMGGAGVALMDIQYACRAVRAALAELPQHGRVKAHGLALGSRRDRVAAIYTESL